MDNDMSENNQQTEEAAKRLASDYSELLACPDCGGKAKDYCVIDIRTDNWQTTVPLSNKKYAQAKCKRCGYHVSILTTGDLKVIRKLWNTRAS